MQTIDKAYTCGEWCVQQPVLPLKCEWDEWAGKLERRNTEAALRKLIEGGWQLKFGCSYKM